MLEAVRIAMSVTISLKKIQKWHLATITFSHAGQIRIEDRLVNERNKALAVHSSLSSSVPRCQSNQMMPSHPGLLCDAHERCLLALQPRLHH